VATVLESRDAAKSKSKDMKIHQQQTQLCSLNAIFRTQLIRRKKRIF